MPYSHLKRAHTKTTKRKKGLFNVASGAIVRPLSMVNSQKQRLTTLFFAGVFVASFGLAPFAYYSEAHATSGPKYQTPKPLRTEEQQTAKINTDGITESAKATATPIEDPVTAYQRSETQRQNQPQKKVTPILSNEIKEKRTAYSNTYLNTEGGETERIYAEPVNYKSKSSKDEWTPIEGQITADKAYNESESAKESIVSRIMPGKAFIKKGLRQDTGFTRTVFKSLDVNDGITVGFDGTDSFRVALLGANPKVNPELKVFEDGKQYTLYENAWNNADVYYEQRSTSLKETIVLKSKDVPTTFSFRYIGAKMSYGVDAKGSKDGTIVATLPDGNRVVLPELTITSKVSGPLDSPKMHYEIDGDVVRVVLDAEWFKTIPKEAFPIIVDPTYDWRGVSTGIPGGDLGQFIAYDSRGYRCNSNVCDVYAGALNSGGWKNWRTMMRLPLTNVYGQSVSWANIYTERVNRPNVWNGFNGNRPYEITWAHCFGYNCFSGAPRATTWLDWAGNFDATGLMQWISTNNVGDGWLMIKAVNEGDINSFKSFAGSRTFLDVNFRHWNQVTALPTLSSPAQNEVISVTRPTLKINAVGDPDGDVVRYAFHLLDKKGQIVAHSGELDTTWWTIPDDILIDGETYSWRAFVMERNAGNLSVVESGWRQQPEVRSFKLDLRTGKDKTQTYSTTGPMSVSLNRGNGYTGAETHAMGALGGSIGLGLDYNTPGLTQNGLTGYYYNDTSAGRKHAITVKDANVDMVWGAGSPYPGTMQSDNFAINWQGFFIAPQDGTYVFGANQDDYLSMSITVDGVSRLQFDYGCCGARMSGTSVSLKKGQAYPINIWYLEATGYAAAQLRVRLPSGVEATVPSDMLRTLPDMTSQDNKGLAARFYKTDVNTNPNFVINDQTPLVFSTKVPQLNSNWGTGSLLPYDVGGVYNDFMIVNYSGFITIPADGKYQIGGGSDDGIRIKLGGKEVANSWSPHGYIEAWSPEMDFKAGQIIPISVDYFEYNGGASANLQWKSTTNAVNTGVIPGQYLSTSAQVVPRGWNLSVDPDSNIPYESLQAKPSGNVDLLDSDGYVHAYAWTGSGFKPPLNEDGYLVRNADGTYTLTDSDGRVYNFSTEGLIVRVSSPIEDRNPAALQYEYRNTSTEKYGALPKLSRISDGLDPVSRYGQLYYWGEQDSIGNCAVPSGYEAPAPGMLCAFKTNPDNRLTKLYYKGGQIARIEQPGDQLVDYTYDANGLMKQIRDVLANDAIAKSFRTADGTELTQITYDKMNRVSSVLAPAPFESGSVPAGQLNNRTELTFEYGYQSAKLHTTGAPEPKGYQEFIEFDNLYRTTKACNIEGLCNTSEYDSVKDLMLSVTDSQGLKSTTLYDMDDRAIAQYGPAPVAAFKSDRTPIDISQVPRTETKYDEGIVGAAVAWYDVKNDSLFAAPRLHTTGFDANSPTRFWLDSLNATWPGAPITPTDGATAIGFSAEAKLYVPVTGTYTLGANHEDALRIWVNDQLVVNNWANRGDSIISKSVQITLEGNKPNRIRVDYANITGGRLAFSMDISGNGISSPGAIWGNIMRPGYNLQTSQTVYDAQLGNKTSTFNYGSTPELGLPKSSTVTGGGLSFTASSEYEAPSAIPGSGFSRKISSTLPGGTKTVYAYYGPTEEVDNPCTTNAIEKIRQGGQLRSRTFADPDGDGVGSQKGIKSETIYDEAGRPIASKVNNDQWTCSEYDTRGRSVKVVTSGVNERVGRVLTSDYSVNGNPFVSIVTDSTTGTVKVESDLLGRVLKATDSFGYETTLTYDNLGRISKKTSLKGVETTIYDEYSRPTNYMLDGVVYATMTYDALGRVSLVEYPKASNGTGKLSLSQIKRDASQQNIGAVYTFSDGSTYDETVTRTTQTGLVTGYSITQGGKTATGSYQYDGVGRLTGANIDGWKYDYIFGNQEAICSTLSGYNPNASLNGNRTRTTITNLQTGESLSSTSCYGSADQLISSTDEQIGVPTYDEYGNVTQLAGGGVPMDFTYNANNQNIAISQGGNKVEYTKDAAGNVLVKKEYRNGVLDKVYRNAAGALLTCNLVNQTECGVVDRYIALPGAVVMTLTNKSATEVKATYSIQNFHGDSAMTANASGLATSSVSLYDPFGGIVASVTFGTNIAPENASDISMGWATSPSRKQEVLFSLAVMQMGARVYAPSLGRFLQVDPVQGGTPSAYVYVLDPVNFADYGGQWGVPKWVKVAAAVVVVAVVVVGVVAACIAVCAAIGAAISAAALSAAAYAAQAAATVAALAIAASRGAPAAARVIGTVVKGSKAANNVSKSASAAQQLAKSNAPARLTNPPATSAFEKYTEGMARSNTVQNTTRVDSVLRPGRYRVPDGLNARELVETKNVAYQPLSNQLRDYTAISQRDTLSFILKINSDARLSGPLIDAEKQGLLTIIKY